MLIAEAMAREAGSALDADGWVALLLPPIWYTAAGFADTFPGTVAVEPDTVRDLVLQIAGALKEHEITTLAIANAHLDPSHLGSLREATDAAPHGSRIVFVDLTRRAVAQRLTEEFQTGACHAGRFEGSVVLAETPELYRAEIAAQLEPNPSSLSTAIQAGHRSFEEAGGPRAYFGWPAEATADEGRETVRTLGALLAEAVTREAETREAVTGDEA